MTRTSAGLLPYAVVDGDLSVFLGHMGGPFWARKDEGAWSIVKGEYDPGSEDPLAAARREFAEEVGAPPPSGEPVNLGQANSSRKLIVTFAVRSSPELAYVASNLVTMQWPPRSGRTIEFPELDRAAWLELAEARRLIVASQRVFLDRLAAMVSAPG